MAQATYTIEFDRPLEDDISGIKYKTTTRVIINRVAANSLADVLADIRDREGYLLIKCEWSG